MWPPQKIEALSGRSFADTRPLRASDRFGEPVVPAPTMVLITAQAIRTKAPVGVTAAHAAKAEILHVPRRDVDAGRVFTTTGIIAPGRSF